ncbi:DNA polymerase III subunit gamma/tau [Granulicatella sp. zg-ZJ]|uniref:DNA polymerase III subunit gamma/tau n=1 Tax=Granulicatella sp. zg-ZJ TaxID=2678504 RepID=UPI0013D7CAE2|nr:DNA polymerase III subunit gamma/tau [Granulicatella sp. zg-ZJ]NEW63023.1 DNA polymerase III subunit gamma/tau [Granulicatella sp. zg-ZJ]
MYQALYRVWRPQTFDDVVGQQAVVKTLKNAIATNKVSHAYLFTGSRGTGKTSAAKIFAKAINCPHQENGEPCNKCAICQSITEGSLSDVIEIDAASNNGVEEIRDIRDKSRYAPTEAAYKVYIIDEVHMLSTGAFNALLKTLEEPTQNVIFILATTEPHKIPATIISRAQRFDFKRISQEDIAKRLIYILEQEHIDYEEAAIQIIAKTAQGGMRDALSLLDQAISYGDSVTYENALDVSGSISQEEMGAYLVALSQQDTGTALSILHTILSHGKESTRLLEELLSFSRDILVMHAVGKQTTLVSSVHLDTLTQISSSFIYRFIHELTLTQQAMRVSTQRDLYLEVLTVKMATEEEIPVLETATLELETLKQEVSNLKNQLEKLMDSGITFEKTVEKVVPKPSKPQEVFKPNLARIFNILARATVQDKQKIQDEWQDILSCLAVSQRAKLNASTVLAASPEGVVIGFEYDLLCGLTAEDAELKNDISKHAMRLIQHPCVVECVPHNQWKDVRDKFIQAKKMGTLEQYLTPDVSEKVSIMQAVDSKQFIEETIETTLEEIPEIISKATALFGDAVYIQE